MDTAKSSRPNVLEDGVNQILVPSKVTKKNENHRMQTREKQLMIREESRERERLQNRKHCWRPWRFANVRKLLPPVIEKKAANYGKLRWRIGGKEWII